MKPGSFLLNILVLLSIMVSGQALGPDAAIQSTSQQANSDQPSSVEGATLQMAYSQTIGSEDDTYHFQLSGAGYRATNTTHNLSIDVNESAMTISMAGDTWQLSSNDHASSLTIDENRLTIHRSGFDEWYVNGPVGLQQGFTVYQPSEIAFDVGGTLATTARDQSLSIGDTLTFSGLMAYDAAGQTVPVKFALDKDKLAYVYDDTGATYPLTIDPWVQQQKLVIGDAAPDDWLGDSVALDGNTALIGAPGDACTAGDTCGSAYVFTRSGSIWTWQARLVAADPAPDKWFGASVALDGDTALIGAFSDDYCSPQGFSCGSAYVFTRSGSTWTQQAKLIANDANGDEYLGISVALSGDTALVGAPAESCVAGNLCGSAYVFTRSGSTWSQQVKLTASDGAAGDNFGRSVGLDEDTALIGAFGDCPPAMSNCGFGSAYVFIRSGSTWSQQRKFVLNSPENDDEFGRSVAVEGNTALIGAPGDACMAGDGCGSIFVFTRSGTIWTYQATLTASDAASSDLFGSSVALDGDNALAGAPDDGCAAGNACGSAYIFQRTGGIWNQQTKLTANDAAVSDRFAGDNSVALSADFALIGARNDDCAAGLDCGSAYIFVSNPLSATAACNGPNLDVTISG